MLMYAYTEKQINANIKRMIALAVLALCQNNVNFAHQMKNVKLFRNILAIQTSQVTQMSVCSLFKCKNINRRFLLFLKYQSLSTILQEYVI